MGYFETEISSMRAFGWCIAHANSMCARRVITIQNLCNAWVIVRTTDFLYPTIGVSAQQFNSYSKNELVLKLIDNLLASHYTSLTTKSSHFVWSITLRNLNQFQRNLVCWNHHKSSICLLNLRKIWDGGLTFPVSLVRLTWNDPTMTVALDWQTWRVLFEPCHARWFPSHF